MEEGSLSLWRLPAGLAVPLSEDFCCPRNAGIIAVNLYHEGDEPSCHPTDGKQRSDAVLC